MIRKLTSENIAFISAELAKGVRISKLAKTFNVHPITITNNIIKYNSNTLSYEKSSAGVAKIQNGWMEKYYSLEDDFKILKSLYSEKSIEVQKLKNQKPRKFTSDESFSDPYNE